MAGDLHGHQVGDARVDQIPHRRPPEVVAEHSGTPCPIAGRRPGFPKVSDPLARAAAGEAREYIGDDPPELALQRPYAVELAGQECFQL